MRGIVPKGFKILGQVGKSSGLIASVRELCDDSSLSVASR